jgi:hypothetical protein
VTSDLEDKEGDETAARLLAELTSESDTLLSSELDEMQKIAALTESVASKLTALYQAKFPKACTTCGRIYETREEYLKATMALAQKSTMVNKMGVQEYRNCVCGSTLMVWTKERRDNTPFGNRRRELFEACLQKLKSVSRDPEDVLRDRLRLLFHEVSEKMTKS